MSENKSLGVSCYPSIFNLLKVCEIFFDKNKTIERKYTLPEFRETIKKIVKDCCNQAWKDGKSPIYLSTREGDFYGLEHDLNDLTKYVDLSNNKLLEGSNSLLKSYEEQNIFSDYRIKIMNKYVEVVIKGN